MKCRTDQEINEELEQMKVEFVVELERTQDVSIAFKSVCLNRSLWSMLQLQEWINSVEGKHN